MTVALQCETGHSPQEGMHGYTSVYPWAMLINMKNAAIRLRVERELRASFADACRAENRQASDVLREFMRTYAERNQGGRQASLFVSDRKVHKDGGRTNA